MNFRKTTLLSALLCLASAPVSHAVTITRVSVSSAGVQGNSDSDYTSISSDGRYVAVQSYSNNLVSGDTNNRPDIFVRDRQTNTTTRVSVSSSGAQSSSGGEHPSISSNGRYVAFEATFDSKYGIFVRDRQTNTTTRVSVDTSGEPSFGNAESPSISADGRYVAFSSDAEDLVSGETNGITIDIFVRDLQTNTTKRASVSSAGVQANGAARYPSISGDGRYVAFYSNADNLVSGDTESIPDIFVRDMQTNTTTRVSVSSSGEQGNSGSKTVSMSSNGRYVVFQSYASNLVSGDTNDSPDIFLRDLQTNTTTRVSLSNSGVQGNDSCFDATVSGDGRYVAFSSDASNLVSGDTSAEDIFVRDRQTNTTTLVSGSSATQRDGDSHDPKISSDGLHVAFDSDASNLVSGDTNENTDIFVSDLAGNARPQNVKLEAIGLTAGGTVSDPINKARLFRATYRDLNGYRDVRYAYLQIKSGSSNVLRFAYDLPNNKLYILGDDGKYKGGIRPGTGSVLSNSLGTISFAATKARVVDANTFQIDWTIAAKAPLAGGTHPVLLYVTDKGGLSDGFDQGAKWAITSGP